MIRQQLAASLQRISRMPSNMSAARRAKPVIGHTSQWTVHKALLGASRIVIGHIRTTEVDSAYDLTWHAKTYS